MKSLENEKDILESYGKVVGPWHSAKLEPLGLNVVIGRREGAKVFDLSGKAWYDCHCSGGRNVIGHRAPEMLDALKNALKECDNGNFMMISTQKAALAKLLAEVTPGELKCTVYGVGRGESNDFAMKLARAASGRKEIIAFAGAAHGQTGFALSASDDNRREKLFGPLIPQVKHIPLDEDALRKAISDKTAAVIVEPIQSDAGVVAPPEGFLAEARKLCDQRGAALIFDEGQLAFGRAGSMFACDNFQVVPDVLVVSKGMGGSVYPITAAVFAGRLNRFLLTHPLIHLSTFGGSDVGCLVAIAAINYIKNNRLWENAKAQGAALAQGLKEIIKTNQDCFKEVRGAGLLVGVEASNPACAGQFSKHLAANGVIALPAPGNPAVVRFTPPIDITKNEIDEILDEAGKACKLCQ